MIWVGQQNAPSNMKKILFLGYDKDKTQLIEQIQTHNNHWEVKQTSKKITLGEIKDLDLIISFGYRDIINNEIISHFKKPIINLHLSYLPLTKEHIQIFGLLLITHRQASLFMK